MAEVKIKRLDVKYSPSDLIIRSVSKAVKAPVEKVLCSSCNVHSEIFEKLLPKCRFCDLWADSKGPVVWHHCPTDPKALFIGRNPGKGDDLYGSVFATEKSGGKVFGKYLRELGYQPGEVYVTNVVMCRTPRNGPPTSIHTGTCSGWKLLEFGRFKFPKVVFLMGNDALRLFYGQSYPAVQRVYGDLYLSEFMGEERLFVPVQHPGFILRNPDEWENTATLLRVVRRILDNPEKYGMGGVL